jgi:hypothetical protein
LKSRGLTAKFHGPEGLQVDLHHVQGLKYKNLRNKVFSDFFSNGKNGGLVHGLWTGQHGSSPRWTNDGVDKRRDGVLPVQGTRAIWLASDGHRGRGG